MSENEERGLTEAERARISQKFRAAKALLLKSQKRPRLSIPSYTSPLPLPPQLDEANCSKSPPPPSNGSTLGRAPLSEISVNTPSPLLPFRPIYDSLYDSAATPPPNDGSILFLDEDFDASFLEEIDALCHHKLSKSKAALPSRGSTTDCSEEQHPVPIAKMVGCQNEPFVSDEVGSSASTNNVDVPQLYSKYLEALNERQREAAFSNIATPLMIVAGPGSGKTSTMVGRILVLLSEGIKPSNILAMTFTTAAASEMRDRIETIAGKEAMKELKISTFHSFCLQLCRSHADKLGRTPEFTIFGQGQQRRAVIEAMRLLANEHNKEGGHFCNLVEDTSGIHSPQYLKEKSKKWQKLVTQAKASGRNSEYFTGIGDESGAAILKHYNEILRSCNSLDYHDLISCSVKLLTEFPEVLKECQDLWQAIIVDEFQDTSAMQYSHLQILASHDYITIVGDDDQSIFSFNGADISGFNKFREDFPNHKEIRLNRNYRSTRCIIEAATSLIQNNIKRCQLKAVTTDNSSGSKVIIKECHNEDAQCMFVIDKIVETISRGSAATSSFGNFAILYRRQVSGKVFQAAFRDRKIPFNVHGVGFYRKKVVRAIFAMLNTTLPGCEDVHYRRVFKALLSLDKEEKKKVISHIDKISAVRKCSFISAASDIFNAKISGTFKRSQLTQGRKVLSTLDLTSKLVEREQSISTVITLVANMIPQRYLLEQRAVMDTDGGKLLNEDHDIRSVLQFLLDDVNSFISTHSISAVNKDDKEEKGCLKVLQAFIDFILERERVNFRSRRHDNEDSVTLTTIHQSKGLEWDVVFIVKANESEIPLLHEFSGAAKENSSSLEEERRLLYVAMTRARKKLFLLYVTVDSSWQMLQPSRFLKEIPVHLLEIQQESSDGTNQRPSKECSIEERMPDGSSGILNHMAIEDGAMPVEAYSGNNFLKRFEVDERSVVSHLFHQWAKRQAFRDPKRLLSKVGFVIDERLRVQKSKHKDVLRVLKSCLNSAEAFQYAEYVLRWEELPADQRTHITREKQEHFQKLRGQKSMNSSAPTSKQISYLQNLGCTVKPISRLHASRLIEQYKCL